MCGNPSTIHMEISRIVREIQEDVEQADNINVVGNEGENVTVDSTYEDVLATTVINKVVTVVFTCPLCLLLFVSIDNDEEKK